MIDDDRETVKKMLRKKPDLLLLEPHKIFPNIAIESKLTFQRFYAENPLTMAVKRKQIEMIELMLPHHDKIKDKKTAQKAKASDLRIYAVTSTTESFVRNLLN